MLTLSINTRAIISAFIFSTMVACGSVPKKNVSSINETPEHAAEQIIIKHDYKISASVKQQFAYGIEAMMHEDYHQAIEFFLKVVEKEPRASGPWVNIAIAHRKLDEIDEAGKAIDKAIELNPNNPYALNQAGIIKREKGAFIEAEKFYRSAISEYPNYANAHLNIAVLCDLYLHKIVCAKSHYQAYQEIEKKDDKKIIAWIKDLSRRENKN